MKALLGFLILFCTSISFGRGNESGGGGDQVRADFLKLGEDVVIFLSTDPSGKALADFRQVNIQALEDTLTIDRIVVTDQALVDRTGSVVDAVLRDDKVYLNQARWLSLLGSGQDVRYLVFHEMLRLAGVDDDNYVVSRGLREILARRKTSPVVVTSASIECSKNASPREQIGFTFSRRASERALLHYAFSGADSDPSNEAFAQGIVRMADNEFRFSQQQGGLPAFVTLRFNFIQETADVILGTEPETITVQCSVTTDGGGSAGFSTALSFVAQGM